MEREYFVSSSFNIYSVLAFVVLVMTRVMVVGKYGGYVIPTHVFAQLSHMEKKMFVEYAEEWNGSLSEWVTDCEQWSASVADR